MGRTTKTTKTSRDAAALPRDAGVLRMKKARKLHAIGAKSFRAWARGEFSNRESGYLSQKLAKIVEGAA